MAHSAFDAAKREHIERASAIEAEREAVDKKSRADDARWDKERVRLQAALRRVRD
jgi:hypothetical protein